MARSTRRKPTPRARWPPDTTLASPTRTGAAGCAAADGQAIRRAPQPAYLRIAKKKLIEVALPLEKIDAASAGEKWSCCAGACSLLARSGCDGSENARNLA
jgi:hypothetical protein